MNMKKLSGAVLGLAISSQALAAEVSISLSNLTQNIAFTPLLYVAHGPSASLFTVGEQASASLQAMAEGGDTSLLAADASAAGATVSENPAQGPLMPATTTTLETWDTGDHTHLSITAMILPTNDGFVGLDSWPIPSEPGSYTVYLNAYDAGTEANDELVSADGGMPGMSGIPDAPLFEHGSGGTGLTQSVTNQMVHIHPGNVGDADATGGESDLTNTVHRWLNPVAKVVITVQ